MAALRFAFRLVLDKYSLYNTHMKYRGFHGIIYACRYQVIFCPKYRRKVLVGEVASRLKELVREICAEFDIELLKIDVMPDHVHLILEVNPQFGIHKAVKTIKRGTSRILRKEFNWLTSKIPTLWTNSYFVSTIGDVQPSAIRQYIEIQETSQRKSYPDDKI